MIFFKTLVIGDRCQKDKFNANFVISGMLASLWKVFIKFRLPDEKFTCMGEVCMGMAFMGVTCMGGACMGQGVAIDQIYENS